MRLRDQFQRERWVRLPQLIEPALLEMLCSGLEHVAFRPRVDEGIGAEVCLEFCKTVASFSFLANNHQFFEAVKTIAGWITPNPGGTGPMTVVALMQNLIDATRYQLGLERATYSV